MDHAVDSTTTDDDRTSTWLDVGAADEVRRRRKVVVAHEGGEILVLAHDGGVFAFENLCIHRERPLAKGVVLNGRIVCPATSGRSTWRPAGRP